MALSYIFIPLILLSFFKPEILFIFGLTIFFNIGGFLDINLLGGTGAVNIYDVGFFVAVFSGLIIGKRNKLKLDRNVKIMLGVFLTFSIYQTFVTVTFINADPTLGFIKALVYHKYRIFGIFFIIPAYFFIHKYSALFYRVIIHIGIIVLLAYFITLLTPLELINIVETAPDIVRAQARLSFANYGYISLIFQLGFLALLSGLNIDYKRTLAASYFLMLVTLVLTLTRGTIINVAGTYLILLFLLRRYFNVIISKSILKSAIIILSSSIIVVVLFPGYFDTITQTFLLTFQEAIGVVPEGTTQSRTLFELPILLNLFQQHIFIGTGFLSNYFDSYGTAQELGLADFAVLGNLAIYGIAGFALYAVRYFFIHIYIIRILKLQLQATSKYSIALSNEEIILLLASISIFYGKIFFSLFNFSIDIVYGEHAVMFGLVLGIFFALSSKIKGSYNAR